MLDVPSMEGLGVSEISGDFMFVVLLGNLRRSETELVQRFRICSCLNQNNDRFKVTPAGCPVKRRQGQCTVCVDFCTGLYEVANHLGMAPGRSAIDRRF